MKRSQAFGGAVAGLGVVVVIVGGAFSRLTPDLHDLVHTCGLLLMLLGGAVFLGGSYLGRQMARLGPSAATPLAAQETARNLMIVGATFLVGAFSVGMGLRWVLTPRAWGFWILVGLAALGMLAMLAGALGYAATVLWRGGRNEERLS